MSTLRQTLNIVGAGLAGTLLALMVARRGFDVRLMDRRPDPRSAAQERGRSINLALAARGIHALKHAGLAGRVRSLLVPMRGRMIHEPSGQPTLQPYGQRPEEVVYSIERAELNRLLIEEVARHPNVTLNFGQTCLAAVPKRDLLQFTDDSRAAYDVKLTPTIAADGAGSAVRHSLVSSGHIEAHEEWLDHDYKELALPAIAGRHALDPNALHIWPRHNFMLIALPNTDGSFTATLFMPRTGARSFAALTDPRLVLDFFREEFPDVVPLLPDLNAQFSTHPAGQMATVRATSWHVGGQVLLLGDAAHAIVPFHGQGMNAAFEDCVALDALLADGIDWASAFSEFERQRRPNTEAIAQMALENYTEMRATVLDAGFVRRKALALALEKRFPDRFIPRYAMVMFHPEIPYAEALRRGALQEEILRELDQPLRMTDFTLAERLISARLPALSAT